MTLIRIMLAFALMVAGVAEAHATKVACVSSNGERILAQASLVAPADGQLEWALQGVAATTGSELQKFETISPPSADEFSLTADEFSLTERAGRFEVAIAQVRGSRLVIASAQRACSSSSADGWQELWEATLMTLQERGYTLQSS